MIEDVRMAAAKIETAAFELFEESLGEEYRRVLKEKLGASENVERAVAGFETERTLDEGIYEWTLHLFLLDRAREFGVLGGPETIQAVELRGLGAVGQGRARFRDAHPPCRHCGIPLFERLAPRCQLCGGDLKQKVA